MAGLLGQSPLAGLLSMIQPNAPVMADAADEAMFARNPNGLMAPQRARVNPLRVFDRVLGGQTVSEGLDAERARLAAEANAPAMADQRQRLNDMVAQLPGYLQVAFASNPEEVGKALASNAEGYSLSAGGLRGGLNGVVSSAPTYSTVNDTIYANDRGVSTPTAVAAPGYDDITQRYNADTSRMNADTTAANAGFTLGDGQERYTPGSSTPLAVNDAAPKPPTAQQVEAQGALTTLNTEVLPTLQQMRQALQSGDVITGFGAEARLQAARALATAGNEEARRKVAATEAYRNSSGRLRVGMAKSLGANPSNADIALLEKVTAGDIGQNQDSLLATIDQGLSFANSRAGALGSQITTQAPQANIGPIRVTSVAQARSLPSGTVFIDPNGVQRVVP